MSLSGRVKQGVFRTLQWLPVTGIPALFRLVYGGAGTIFALHSVSPTRRTHYAFQRDLEITEDFLAELIAFCRRQRYDIVTMDEVHERLTSGRGDRRFVAFTFDDGYRNNHEVVYPLFTKQQAPFTVYVVPGLVDGHILPGWFILEDLLQSVPSVRLRQDGSERSLPTTTPTEKERAFVEIANLLGALPVAEQNERLRVLFEDHDVDVKEASRRHMMSWDMVRELARSGVAAIGAHTMSHCSLKDLSESEARHEIAESTRVIEEHTGVAVRHFSYPFGGYHQVGPREIDLAASCGQVTAVTTRTANVFLGHRDHQTALPRLVLSGVSQNIGTVQTLMSGLPSAGMYGFRRVITDHGGVKRYL